MTAAKRLGKELPKIHQSLPPGISLVSAEGFDEWLMDIQVLDNNPIYDNQIFRLKFKFSNAYPIEAPEVVFEKVAQPPRPIPLHPHVYSNGYICLDLLGRDGWSPVHNVQSICVSLQSMLASNTKAQRPPGDAEFVANNRQRPREVRYMYDDDHV